MTIENLTRLINAEALNAPTITSVSEFVFELKHVRRGFTYICLNANYSDIETAIKQGAYAIISEDNVPIIDKEIAFLKVSSLQTAMIKLMRFEATHKDLKFCAVNPFINDFLEKSKLGSNAHVMSKNITELFNQIFHAKVFDTFFGDDTRTLQRISPLFETIYTDTTIHEINPSSIFFTNTVFKQTYYQNLNIPRVFAGMFYGLLKFLDSNKISFKPYEGRIHGHFDPIFIDKNFIPTSFGNSFRAIITESDEDLFISQSIFLNKKFSPDEIKICLPEGSLLKVQNAIYFKNLSEIKKLKNFIYILILCQKEELLEELHKTSEENLLF